VKWRVILVGAAVVSRESRWGRYEYHTRNFLSCFAQDSPVACSPVFWTYAAPTHSKDVVCGSIARRPPSPSKTLPLSRRPRIARREHPSSCRCWCSTKITVCILCPSHGNALRLHIGGTLLAWSRGVAAEAKGALSHRVLSWTPAQQRALLLSRASRGRRSLSPVHAHQGLWCPVLSLWKCSRSNRKGLASLCSSNSSVSTPAASIPPRKRRPPCRTANQRPRPPNWSLSCAT
jgi:hypothetical protein